MLWKASHVTCLDKATEAASKAVREELMSEDVAHALDFFWRNKGSFWPGLDVCRHAAAGCSQRSLGACEALSLAACETRKASCRDRFAHDRTCQDDLRGVHSDVADLQAPSC